MRKQHVVLEHQAEPAAVDGHVGKVLTVPRDDAGGEWLQAADRAQERGLPRAAWAEHAEPLAVANLESDVIHGRRRAEADGDVVDPERHSVPCDGSRTRSMRMVATATTSINRVAMAIA